jgi:protein-S-isoprenylcysteine O-methyltransferase Ste14
MSSASHPIPLHGRILFWISSALVAVSLAVALLSSPVVSTGSWKEFDIDMLAWLAFVVGAGIRWWSAFYRIETPGAPLATSGPYSICRHPVRWGNLFLGFSLACFLCSLTCAVGFLIAAIGYFSLSIAAEERKLRERFGEEYERYSSAVPRFWPRIWLFRTPENIDIDIATLARELRQMAIWVWLPAIGKAAVQCRAAAWWPHFFGLP